MDDVAGFTLIEVLIVLALLGVLASVSAVALRSTDSQESPTRSQLIQEARETAIRTGSPVVMHSASVSGGSILFLPDGRVVGDGFDPFTGEEFP